MGPGFTMGNFSVAPLHLTITKVPAVPLFAAVPAHQSRALLALMIAPLAVGLFVGWVSREIAPRPLARLRAIAVAAAVVGAVAFLLAALSGGRLGGGAFSPVTAPAGLVGAVALGWVLVPAGLVAWLGGPKPARVRRRKRPVPVVEAPVAEEPVAAGPVDEELAAEEADDNLEADEDEYYEDGESGEKADGEFEAEADEEPDVLAELEAEADAELAAQESARESAQDDADGDEDHSSGDARRH
jgi:hypothetical protein